MPLSTKSKDMGLVKNSKQNAIISPGSSNTLRSKQDGGTTLSAYLGSQNKRVVSRGKNLNSGTQASLRKSPSIGTDKLSKHIKSASQSKPYGLGTVVTTGKNQFLLQQMQASISPRKNEAKAAPQQTTMFNNVVSQQR